MEMGPALNPEVIEKSVRLMAPLQASRDELKVTKDVEYGPDPLQKLDVYSPKDATAPAVPVILFVHGGGFRSLDKRGQQNIPAYFARHRMVGMTMNYRLAPAATWPAQSLHIGAAVNWLKTNADRFGGDPKRIVIIGHSSGAGLVASYLFDHSIETTRDGVIGAVLISGVYGYYSGYSSRAPYYYGEDPTTAEQREPRSHLKEQHPPIMVTAAEFDPSDISAESHAFMAAVCTEDKRCPPYMLLAGHNHASEIHSIDTADDRLGGRALAFVSAVAK
jgi:triacylglycerol lipase